MWDSIVGAVSSVTDSVTTGIVGTGEKLPYSSSVPFKKFSEAMVGAAEYTELFHQEMMTIKNSPKWKPMEDAKDPVAGGDMICFTQDQTGTYHFLKSVFSIKNAQAADIMKALTSPKAEVRQKFSADLSELNVLKEKEGSQLIHISYNAPPGAAGRDFVFLANTKESDMKREAWGCSVDIASLPEDHKGFVRGASQYLWEAQQNGDDVIMTYVVCFDPRGWTPPFLISWFKSTAITEFAAVRTLCEKKGAGSPAAAAATAAA